MNEVTPSIYKETGSFRHWCYKILPLVYDDSLSYYELLCKVVKAIGDVISNMDGVRDDMDKLVVAYNELKNYVDTYFDSLDVNDPIRMQDILYYAAKIDKVWERLIDPQSEEYFKKNDGSSVWMVNTNKPVYK